MLGGSIPPEYMIAASISQCAVAMFFSLRKDRNFVNPYNINLFALILMNIGNLSLLSRIENGTNYMYFFASVPDIPLAAQIWCIGNSVFLVGYLAFSTQESFPSIGLKLNRSHTTFVFWFILFLNQFSSKLAFLGPLSKALGLVGIVGILFFARLWGAEGDKKYRNYAFVLFFFQIYHALTDSYLRFEILLPVIIFFAGYFTGKGDLKYAFTYRILPFIIAVGLFINIFSELGKSRNHFGNAFVEVYFTETEVSEEDPEEVYDETIDRGGFFDRSATLAQVSATVKLVNASGFYNGRASEPLLVAVVPRFLWPDKPKIALGQWFAVEIGTSTFGDAANANNSVNITIPGELYLDFGWFGVIIGCFLFGALICQLWNSTQFFGSHYNLIGSIYGGYMLFLALTGVSIDLQITVTYLSVYLVFLLIKRIAISASK